MNRPRLTESMCDKLIELCHYAEAQADVAREGTTEQQKHSDEIYMATSWVRKLVMAKRSKDDQKKAGGK